jgi:branched-subunit amino acid transport protein
LTGTALWLAVIGMGVATYALRISFIALLARMELPRAFREALGLVPAAVLAALVFPAFFRPGGTIDVSLANEHFLAGALAAVVAWRTRSVLLTIGVGMAALVALRAMGQAF